ncbi:MAG: carboxypeptidase regulatory-like domain-containing protein, partial [Methanomicrobia archaeon]|nr:carboxypeptidase regulatory-like domain-containing protein [Methanomicrobia archaeon]
MKLEIKKYMSIFVCVAFLLSVISINNIDTVKAQPAVLVGPVTLSGRIFEDIGADSYFDGVTTFYNFKNGLNADTDADDWDPWFNPGGTEDNGQYDAPVPLTNDEGLVGVDVYFDNNPVPIATTVAGGAWVPAAPITTFLGKHYLTFRMDGYVTKTRNIDIYASPIDVNATFLERADAVIGRVTDTSGTPIIGARVIAYPRGTTTWLPIAGNAVGDAFSTAPPFPDGTPCSDGTHTIEGFTDRFGNYVLKGLQKGNYEIRVTREEYSPQFKTIYGINTDLG